MGGLLSSSVAADEFSGKTVWVVGASSGIGEAMAEAYYQRGAKVIVSARREQALEDLVQRLKSSPAAPGADAKALVVDTADLDKAKANAEAALEAFGPIDVVVLSAGISNRGSVADTDISVEQRLFQVNFFGTVAITKAMLPHFFEHGSGCFVVVSSVQGLMGLPQRAPYAASKHALHGYFESLRAEVAHKNVAVHIVCPGYVKTDLSNRALTTSASAEYAKTDETTASGFEPKYVAERSLTEIKNKKEYIVIAQTKAVLALWLRKHFPSVLRKIMNARGKAADTAHAA
ncbi:Dehydrogenase/reductase SDR family protein 7-like [Hondaea fermentalgiana]|uniref:Dehydrogenase/reductase SDR family protein 7-like n=1 Tax=Hondaea fermentalgiana TaxID=2315210 RepID=A0A2R5G7A1_9STRA|nr:Dehydrogenase/reductase SDR family protein 7-like [Hondaea fermentalgiana]|eukprot:GBG24333.1 Dehydrogenase/reductase SDR family protein 7-like [Hondaea fermentalgiana]